MSEIASGPGWELRLGDCLDPRTGIGGLQNRGVHHVITDPPYSQRVHQNLGAEQRADGWSRHRLSFEHLGCGVASGAAGEFARITSRWILIFSDDLNVSTWAVAMGEAGAQYVVKGTWVKRDPMPQMTGDRPAYGSEEIVICHAHRERGRMKWNGGGKSAVYIADARNHGERHHPTQKPLPLFESLVRDFTDPGEIVCDPFAGSGTTGVACIRLGRRFIGWEKSPEYFRVAVKRLTAAREQLRLFEGTGT